VMVQVLCSYITLPLYALVTQMGSEYKSAILEEHTVHAIKQWHANVKQKRKRSDKSGNNIQDDSSTLGSTASPDISSHRRAPSLTEFAASHEITEHIETDPHGHHHHLDSENQNGLEYDHDRV
ncbi:UNVERIFIED_CONTAM: MLO-like protein 10, partial [Sesamum radiatum]